MASQFFAAVRILNARLRFVLLMVIVGVLASQWDNLMNYVDRWQQQPVEASLVGRTEHEFFCPMHPTVIRDAQGQCPICGMPLSQRERGEKPALPADVLARVQLTPYRVQLAGLATSPVEYRLLSREIRSVGTIEHDETCEVRASARIRGRIEKQWVNFVGQSVKRGDPLFSIYSPQLLIAQREVLDARRNLTSGSADAATTYEAARRKLVLWGIDDAQIDELERRGTAEDTMTYRAPIDGIVVEKKVLPGQYVNEGDPLYTIYDLSRVWLQVRVFEDEFAGVAIGTAVEVTSAAFPTELFAGRIGFIAYTVDPATRTVAARVEVANPDLKLRPGMYAHAAIRIPVGRVTPLDAATQPASAPAAEGSEPTANLLRACASLASDLSIDRTDSAAGVAQAARRLHKETPGNRTEALAKKAAELPGKPLDKTRELFKEINKDAAAIAKAQPPRGGTWYVAHCPMVDADWIQESTEISNPYDPSMLRCGVIAATLAAGGASESDRAATGFFCPIYPDRLFDKPAECPVDKFPMKRVRIEKSLAVPASAVIDTGTRRVAYLQSSPGVFDMVEVRLGARAGEWYPVLAGLHAGGNVVTRGAFLVDAENRLNPAAAAQYFGANADTGDGR